MFLVAEINMEKYGDVRAIASQNCLDWRICQMKIGKLVTEAWQQYELLDYGIFVRGHCFGGTEKRC